MRRRSGMIGVIAGLAVLALPGVGADKVAATGQPARVLHVTDYPSDLAQKERAALLQAFAGLGYAEGRSLELTTYDVGAAIAAEARSVAQPSAGDQFGPNPYTAVLATSIARLRPHLLLVSGPRVLAATRDSGVTTPVVFWRVSDPVGLGFVATLARPGGNLTGFSRATEKLAVKRLELLHEMVPSARAIAFVFVEDLPSHARQAADVKAAAARVGVRTHEYALPLARWNAVELDALFATLRREGIEAFLLPDTNVLPPLLTELAARHRLPTIYGLSGMVTDLGGLAAYSTQANSFEDVVGYAVRILRGERPADLPVQESTRFEFILNAKAARDLGLTFPASLLLRANQVVEK
jgi:putative ABC transport system substrate-binding protein